MNKQIFTLALFFLCLAIQMQANGKSPKLTGDGIADDTQAIQALLDSKAPVVYLPPVKRISISNIFGSYYTNAIAFTHWRMIAENPRFEDIAIHNVFTAKVTDSELLDKLSRKPDNYGIIGIEGQLSFNNLTLSNIFRTEWLPGAAPTIHIQQGTIIETLRLNNVQQHNRTNQPLTLLHNEACIMQLFMNEVVIVEKNEDKAVVITGNGRILHRQGEPVILGEGKLREESERVKEEMRINLQKGQVL